MLQPSQSAKVLKEYDDDKLVIPFASQGYDAVQRRFMQWEEEKEEEGQWWLVALKEAGDTFITVSLSLRGRGCEPPWQTMVLIHRFASQCKDLLIGVTRGEWTTYGSIYKRLRAAQRRGAKAAQASQAHQPAPLPPPAQAAHPAPLPPPAQAAQPDYQALARENDDDDLAGAARLWLLADSLSSSSRPTSAQGPP